MEFHPCHFHNSSWIVILSKSNIRWKIWKHYIFYSHSKFRDPLGGTSSPALVHKHLKKVNWVSNSIFHRCINVWSWYVKFRVSMIQSNVHSSGPQILRFLKTSEYHLDLQYLQKVGFLREWVSSCDPNIP